MPNECTCVTCSGCRGMGSVRVEYAHSPDGFELETCDECEGSGITEMCDSCFDQRDIDADSWSA